MLCSSFFPFHISLLLASLWEFGYCLHRHRHRMQTTKNIQSPTDSFSSSLWLLNKNTFWVMSQILRFRSFFRKTMQYNVFIIWNLEFLFSSAYNIQLCRGLIANIFSKIESFCWANNYIICNEWARNGSRFSVYFFNIQIHFLCFIFLFFYFEFYFSQKMVFIASFFNFDNFKHIIFSTTLCKVKQLFLFEMNDVKPSSIETFLNKNIFILLHEVRSLFIYLFSQLYCLLMNFFMNLMRFFVFDLWLIFLYNIISFLRFGQRLQCFKMSPKSLMIFFSFSVQVLGNSNERNISI